MKNLKKVLSLVLALAMAMSLMTVAFAKDASDFTDADEITYTEAVEVMTAIGVFNGVGDGSSFNPTGTLTREQAAKIITYMLLGQEKADKLTTAIAPYSDVAADRWSAGAIAYCTSEGIIAGDGTGKFNPTGTLTGIQFAKLVLAALGFDATENGLVGDSWAINTSKLIVAEELDDNLDVDSSAMTREEAAQMALNAVKWTGNEDVYGVDKNGDGIADITFTDRTDALMYALSKDAYAYVGPVEDITGSLLDEVFEVSLGTGVNSLGYPATVYSNSDWDEDLKYAEEADYCDQGR